MGNAAPYSVVAHVYYKEKPDFRQALNAQFWGQPLFSKGVAGYGAAPHEKKCKRASLAGGFCLQIKRNDKRSFRRSSFCRKCDSVKSISSTLYKKVFAETLFGTTISSVVCVVLVPSFMITLYSMPAIINITSTVFSPVCTSSGTENR